MATTFVTLPFVVREVEPVLHEIGDEQEQAADTLGAGPGGKTFWRITLPSIRWGLAVRRGAHRGPLTGRVRGALIVVAGGVSGESRLLPSSYTRAISMTTTHSAPTPRPPC